MLANCVAKCARILENRIPGRPNHSDRHGAPDVLIHGVSTLFSCGRSGRMHLACMSACPHIWLAKCARETNARKMRKCVQDSSQPLDRYTSILTRKRTCVHACVDVYMHRYAVSDLISILAYFRRGKGDTVLPFPSGIFFPTAAQSLNPAFDLPLCLCACACIRYTDTHKHKKTPTHTHKHLH